VGRPVVRFKSIEVPSGGSTRRSSISGAWWQVFAFGALRSAWSHKKRRRQAAESCWAGPGAQQALRGPLAGVVLHSLTSESDDQHLAGRTNARRLRPRDRGPANSMAPWPEAGVVGSDEAAPGCVLDGSVSSIRDASWHVVGGANARCAGR